jgi:iron-sulfur cluster insertion protein
MQITIADSAILRVIELIKQSKDTNMIGLRVSVFGGGCSGFMYNYKLESKQNDDDLVIDSNGVKFLVDSASQPFLEDSTLEFVQELGASYFKVSNPNATSKCGCGSSFSI